VLDVYGPSFCQQRVAKCSENSHDRALAPTFRGRNNAQRRSSSLCPGPEARGEEAADGRVGAADAILLEPAPVVALFETLTRDDPRSMLESAGR
jgi:hypothetical protein